MMPGDLKDLLRVFSAHWVKYLVVGGYAYGVHAEPRATKDLDIFISRDEGNSEAVFRALIECGAPLDGLSASDFRDGSHFQIGQPPARRSSSGNRWHHVRRGLERSRRSRADSRPGVRA